MAEGILRHLGGGTLDVFSAGTHPSFVHPTAIQVMSEIGIDISRHTSKSVEQFMNEAFDYVITVCDSAKERCPYFAGGKKKLHIPFEDPVMVRGNEEERVQKFREVRDNIMEAMKKFLQREQLLPEQTTVTDRPD
jgi:arsenate reductase